MQLVNDNYSTMYPFNEQILASLYLPVYWIGTGIAIKGGGV
jgi:hypothetical protein